MTRSLAKRYFHDNALCLNLTIGFRFAPKITKNLLFEGIAKKHTSEFSDGEFSVTAKEYNL